MGYVDAIIGKLKKEFVRKVVVDGDVAVIEVEVLVKLVDITAAVVLLPPPPSAKPDVVVVAVLLETVVAREIIPVQTAPVGQQAT